MLLTLLSLRVGLDYGEGVHWSNVMGECSNVIGYEMSYSPARVLHCSQGFSRGEVRAWMKK